MLEISMDISSSLSECSLLGWGRALDRMIVGSSSLSECSLLGWGRALDRMIVGGDNQGCVNFLKSDFTF